MTAGAEPPPLASVLVPTHDRARSLELAVRSALAQTETRVEVIVIGDGVTARSRNTIEALVREDPRVRFLDRPKGDGHGEPYRHEAILAAQSDHIFYLCDDDLLLRDHVAALLALLADHDFVQSLNGSVAPDRTVDFYPGDLAHDDAVQRILRDDVFYNFVSLTGTAHRRSFYLDCAAPWEDTPTGVFPDYHQWRRMLTHPTLRTATAPLMTALQFPTSEHGRDRWSEAERLAELERWAVIVAGDDAQTVVDDLVAQGARRRMERDTLELIDLRPERDALRAEVDGLRVEVDGLRGERDELAARSDRLDTELAFERERNQAMIETRSWKITAPLRALRARQLARRAPTERRDPTHPPEPTDQTDQTDQAESSGRLE
jgi:hypothetical protein